MILVDGLHNLEHNQGCKTTYSLMCDWMPGEGTVFDHVILRHGEELGLLGMTQDGVMQNLKLSDLKFVYVFYKLYGVF